MNFRYWSNFDANLSTFDTLFPAPYHFLNVSVRASITVLCMTCNNTWTYYCNFTKCRSNHLVHLCRSKNHTLAWYSYLFNCFEFRLLRLQFKLNFPLSIVSLTDWSILSLHVTQLQFWGNIRTGGVFVQTTSHRIKLQSMTKSFH